MTNCIECENLNRIYESKLTKYLTSRVAVLYRISTKFAAKQQVDMERAKNDRDEHVLICPFVADEVRCLAMVPLQEPWALERLR
jgi:hypothetical protein